MTARTIAEALAEQTTGSVRETRGSFVVVAPDRVWKIRKHERLAPHDDRSTLDGRRAACHEEFLANAALAPRIYLGVRALVELDGRIALGPAGEHAGAVEYAVEMMPFEPEWTLASMLSDGRAGRAELDAVGAAVAAFHAAAPAAEPGRALTNGALCDHAEELRARCDAGLVRDGHGDLRADHVLLTVPLRLVGRPPARQERCADVAVDVATLAADVVRLGPAGGVDMLLDAYARAGGPMASRPLVHALSGM